MAADNARNQAGFTLIEVLVAFAILGLAAGALLSIFSSNPLRILHAGNERTAVLAAKSVLARVGNEQPVEKGEYRGLMPGGIRWIISIQPYAQPPQAQKNDGAPTVTTPYLVTVHAAVGAESNAPEAVITSVRLGMAAP